MSDESTSSAAARPQPVPQDQLAGNLRDVFSDAIRRRQIKKQKSSFNRMRAHLLDDLVRNLDIVVYAELSTIYYLDCHIFRFLLRAIVQFMFLTPKPPLFPSPPKPEPVVGGIVGSNVLCLILHIFSTAPSAGENTRFYMHGGLIIDFIGQRGPTSKLLLIALDFLVFVLQLVHLSTLVTSRRLREKPESHREVALVTQDLDSEERGVRRSVEIAQEQVQDGIELQALNPNGGTSRGSASNSNGGIATNTGIDGDEVSGAGAGPSRHANDAVDTAEPREGFEDGPRPDSVLFDAFKNGQIVLADLNILKTVQEQVLLFRKTPPEARRNALSAHLAGRVMGLRILTGRTAS